MPDDITIEAADAGKRLDVHLSAVLTHLSRAKVQKAIKAGNITLNGKLVTPHVALRAGDRIVIDISDSPARPLDHSPAPRPEIPLAIVHDDDAVVVIDKPSGLLVHPTVRGETETLAGALIARYPSMTDVGESPDRPGIVHRLDKDASGLLVAAKTQRAYESLKKQFQEHEIKKTYLVLVHGRPPSDEGVITLAIGRSAAGTTMAARHRPLEGDREAETRYRVEKVFKDAALLRVNTGTGRTHQIRAHFKAIGCPVAGDPLYKGRNAKPLPVSRLFLHATELGFNHPTRGEWMEFSSPLPDELAKALKKL
jgi:23S rRNA pseudouridine1911/1915/1917 synthase